MKKNRIIYKTEEEIYENIRISKRSTRVCC